MTAKLECELKKVKQELAALKAEYQEFVYITSHDLSAPLRQVDGFADLIISKHGDSFDDKTKRHFALISNGVTQAKSILDALTDYSRINTRAQPFTECDSRELVEQVLSGLSTLITETKAEITCTDLPIITADNAQLKLLFECVIKNALTYQLPDNKPVITLSAKDDENFWYFCISDNGIGVSENLTEKIFKVLRRGVSNKSYPGLGMGLAIVTKILQRHKGEISVSLNNKKGADFTFTIAKDLPNE